MERTRTGSITTWISSGCRKVAHRCAKVNDGPRGLVVIGSELMMSWQMKATADSAERFGTLMLCPGPVWLLR